MNGELNYDDILHFPNEIVVEKINNFGLKSTPYVV